jgi:hypothetical protein
MARPRKSLHNESFLRAALEGLELMKQRIENQLSDVRSQLGLGSSRRGRPAGSKNKKAVAEKAPGKRRKMSAAARKRIAAAQKLRWAKFHASKKS